MTYEELKKDIRKYNTPLSKERFALTYEELKKAYEAAMQKCSELESQNAELESEKTREC